MENRIPQAKKAALRWLALVDAGDYEKSWQTSGSLFHAAMNSAEWAQTAKQVRNKLGRVINREEAKSIALETIDGFPDGNYVVIEYETVFAEGGTAGERVTTLESDTGTVRVVGYYVI